MKKIKTIALWSLVFLVMGIIFYFSSKTGIESNEQSDPIVFSLIERLGLSRSFWLTISFIIRKLGHISEYALLGLLMILAVSDTFSLSPIKSFSISVLLSYLYAVTDEIHQLFIEGRTGAFIDTLIDLIGILIGCLIFLGIKKLADLRRPKK